MDNTFCDHFFILRCQMAAMESRNAVDGLLHRKNQYKQPSDEEMEECTGFVVENMVKDFSKKH